MVPGAFGTNNVCPPVSIPPDMLSSGIHQNCMNLPMNAHEIQRRMCTPGSLINNKTLLRQIDPTMGSLSTLLSTNADAASQFSHLMESYGVLDPQGINSQLSLKLPDPHRLVKNIEEATALHIIFKQYLQDTLEKTKKYLQRSAVLLAEITHDIKNKYKDLRRTISKHQSETSPHIKSILGKKIIQTKEDLQLLIKEFEQIRKWQMIVTCSIATNL
ncbi:hypothetical protein NUSPORA_02049 [Nucleospora cyclopteri]